MPKPVGHTSFWDRYFFSWANSVWFGIAMLIAIFVYSSLGSAIPPLRQHPLLEMTEMEWFHWWPFDVLIGLLCMGMIVVTLKQIPLRWMNAGVWTIHTGIIILAAGSVYYFGTKLEGDVPVFRRQALITIPGRSEPVSLLVRPDNHVSIGEGRDAYHFSVSQIFPDWKIASGEDAGTSAYMVWVDVVTPEQRFTRQLLAGYPQYTEDILPDRTRAKKTLGKPLVDESLEMRLDYLPQTDFYLMDSAALFARRDDSQPWIHKPIHGLPHYHERIASYDDVIVPEGAAIPLRPIDLPVAAATEPGDPLAGYDVRVTSYLRYAFLSTQWRQDGENVYPVADVALVATTGARADHTMMAFDADQYAAEDGLMAFRWVDSAADVDRLLQTDSRLELRVPDHDIVLAIPMDAEFVRAADDAPFVTIEGTAYAYRIKHVARDLFVHAADHSSRPYSVATVELKLSDRQVTRFVADDAAATRDLGPDGTTVEPDGTVIMTYFPGNRDVVSVVAGQAATPAGGTEAIGPYALIRSAGGEMIRHDLELGRPVTIRTGISLVLRRLLTHAVREVKPNVVPFEQRERNAREMFSMIRVDISKGDWSVSRWLEFNRYPFPNEQYAIPRRTTYLPTHVELPDGQSIELIFSRQRRPLPAPIALERFDLATHTGGYTGETITIRDFISELRFKTEDGWSEPMQMSSNNPATWGGYWYFQSEWDPPAQGYSGMNYTGLGVGNRNGVYIQLTGTCIAVLGMIYAFYVKPVLRRRMQERRTVGGSKGQAVATVESTSAGNGARSPQQTCSQCETFVGDDPSVRFCPSCGTPIVRRTGQEREMSVRAEESR